MATPDLRFFATPHGRRLPDGHPRRGISVVAALSRWLTHTNRRPDGAWTQRYEHGVPTADLIPIPPSRTPGTGTTVRFDATPPWYRTARSPRTGCATPRPASPG
jgi:topoisomerase-4 subunit B